MMRQYELVERIQSYKSDVNEALLNKAYVYAMQKHGMQKRASGDPYFSHPLEVAGILTDMGLDESTIVVALLHDTIEDTSATRSEIDELFGEDIGHLVEGLTKLKKLNLVSKKAMQAENLRKLLLAISDDVRVLLVKLADRLHNMRTLHHVPEAKQKRIAEETMEIYAPLAGRMGMQDMREELEGLAFRYLNPEGWRTVTRQLDQLVRERKGLTGEINEQLAKLFEENELKASVTSRQKKPWSISRKMEAKVVAFRQLSDIFGFRVYVETKEDCYRALGIIHTTWPSVPGRFKDYISSPKLNDYQSLHTTVVGPSRQRVELQIRTWEMHEICEYGVAAHAIYTDQKTTHGGARHVISKDTNAYAWLRRTIDALATGDRPEEFLENTKLELFQDQVFCFTPKGEVIALPRGAIAIDFAYAVHTDVGDTCVGAKVNGRNVPLMTKLENGDEVEIVRSSAQVAPAAWESAVVTGKARAAIRRASRDAVRTQYKGLGTRIMERAADGAGKNFSPLLVDGVLAQFSFKERDDLLAAVGRGELPSSEVLNALYPDSLHHVTKAKEPQRATGWFNLRNAAGMLFRVPGQGSKEGKGTKAALPIRGTRSDLPVKFAEEGAVPGDRIVGILTPGEGITIYPIHSQSLALFEDHTERWIDVCWEIDLDSGERFPAQVVVTAINAPGSLAEIANVIAANDANIHRLSMVRTAPDFTEMKFDIEVWNLKYLNQLIASLKLCPAVSKATRLHG